MIKNASDTVVQAAILKNGDIYINDLNYQDIN